VSTAPVFGLPLRVVVGASYDRGDTQFSGSSELGALTPDRTVVGVGAVLDQPEGGVAPVRLRSTNDYFGLYGSATLDLTPRVSATVGGRYNHAEIELRDRIGTALNGRHDFSRFNPAAGLTWRFADGATAYAGYSEANRAPSPAELSCADPLLPCTLGAFFLADPPLRQVVSRTVEAGLRGAFETERLGLGGRLRWNLGVFRTGLEDDILLVQSELQGRGYFQNAGDTRRQGVEAGLSWRGDRLALGLDYALIDATFRTAQRLPSPNHPLAEADGAIPVERGDRIPGIPRHRLRFDAEWRPVPAWAVGGNVVVNSGQYLRGDEGNLLKPIGGYALVNLRTSLRVGPGVELYGIVRNLFDKRFATFGTLYDVGLAEASLGLGLSDPRTVSPGLPRTVFGGVRVVF
jgi:outer membrane receptor protein involved in Fe transport